MTADLTTGPGGKNIWGRRTAVHGDVVFATRPGFRPLALDLYVPDEPAALCLYLHGGGWRVGSRREGPGCFRHEGRRFFELLAGLGLAVASLDYRLSGEAHYPAQQDDVAAAAAYLRDHASEFGLPPLPTVVWGASAGGQLAAIHALDHPDEISAAVCWYPPTDLTVLPDDVSGAARDVVTGSTPVGGAELVTGSSAPSREEALIGYPLGERPDLYARASAVTHVGAVAPPFLLVHGSADVDVPPSQSHRLAETLEAAGHRVEVDLVPGATHMFPELDEPALTALAHRSADFLLS